MGSFTGIPTLQLLWRRRSVQQQFLELLTEIAVANDHGNRDYETTKRSESLGSEFPHSPSKSDSFE